MQTAPHRPSEFIAPHLFLQVLLSGICLATLPFGVISLAIPLIVAVLPLLAYFLPNVTKEASETYLRSIGAALVCALAIYAAWFGIIMWLLGGMKFM